MLSRTCTLSSLLPLGVDAKQRAEGTSKTDDAVIEVDPGKSAEGNSQVAKVRGELDAAGGALAITSISHR